MTKDQSFTEWRCYFGTYTAKARSRDDEPECRIGRILNSTALGRRRFAVAVEQSREALLLDEGRFGSGRPSWKQIIERDICAVPVICSRMQLMHFHAPPSQIRSTNVDSNHQTTMHFCQQIATCALACSNVRKY